MPKALGGINLGDVRMALPGTPGHEFLEVEQVWGVGPIGPESTPQAMLPTPRGERGGSSPGRLRVRRATEEDPMAVKLTGVAFGSLAGPAATCWRVGEPKASSPGQECNSPGPSRAAGVPELDPGVHSGESGRRRPRRVERGRASRLVAVRRMTSAWSRSSRCAWEAKWSAVTRMIESALKSQDVPG